MKIIRGYNLIVDAVLHTSDPIYIALQIQVLLSDALNGLSKSITHWHY